MRSARGGWAVALCVIKGMWRWLTVKWIWLRCRTSMPRVVCFMPCLFPAGDGPVGNVLGGCPKLAARVRPRGTDAMVLQGWPGLGWWGDCRKSMSCGTRYHAGITRVRHLTRMMTPPVGFFRRRPHRGCRPRGRSSTPGAGRGPGCKRRRCRESKSLPFLPRRPFPRTFTFGSLHAFRKTTDRGPVRRL